MSDPSRMDPESPNYDPYWLEREAYARSSQSDQERDVVQLGTVAVPIQGSIAGVNLATLQPRLTIGDHTLASDNFFSVWIDSDWRGGALVQKLREPSDVGRFWYGTAETLYTQMLTQPLEVVSYTHPAGAPVGGYQQCTPLGDYTIDGVRRHLAAWDLELRYHDLETDDWVFMDTLTAPPAGVRKGITYDDRFWIPQGASGYDVVTGTTIIHNEDMVIGGGAGGGVAITPLCFVEWDDKLVCLTTDGRVAYILESTSAGWLSPAGMRLRGDRKPRSLQVFWDQQGTPTLYAITSRDVWAVDWLVPILYRTGLRFPVHPDHGRAAAVWRDDQLYVSVAIGVHSLSRGGVVAANGLDARDGLPAQLRGVIQDMEPEYNGLLVFVAGTPTPLPLILPDDTPPLEETMIRPDPMVVPIAGSTARSTIQRWTGVGWHTVWESPPDALGLPSTVCVTEAEDEYRLMWGHGGAVYSQRLRRTFYNPEQGAAVGIDRFQTVSYLRTGRFDANLSAFVKLTSHIEVQLDPSSTGRFEVWCRTDRDDWVLCGVAERPGRNVILLDMDGDGWAEGHAWTWIEYEYRLISPDPLHPVIANWIGTYFVVLPIQTRSWRLNVPMLFDEEWLGVGPRQMADYIDGLATAERFDAFKTRDRVYRVHLAQTQGPEETGHDPTAARTVTLIEVQPRPIETEGMP